VSILQFAEVFAPGLLGVRLDLTPGLHVIVGTPQDGTTTLAKVASGSEPASRGRVLVAGHDPWSSPQLRRRLGVVLASEPPAVAASVRAALERAVRLRGERTAAEQLAQSAGIAAWLPRKPRDLSASERRALAMVIALSLADPIALVLHEPLSQVAALPRAFILEGLNRARAAGAVIVVTTASPRDAAALGGTLWLLDHGRIVRRPGAPIANELAPGMPLTLKIRSDDPRALGERLLRDKAVSAVSFDSERDPKTVSVRGDSGELALAVARAQRDSGLSIHALHPVLPSLEETRAASAGLWRAAYERAYQSAREQTARAAQARPEWAPASAASGAATSAPPVAAGQSTPPGHPSGSGGDT
jgi:ABC-type multidrug transport system ATPase subunit